MGILLKGEDGNVYYVKPSVLREKLFHEQCAICHWCHEPMRLVIFTGEPPQPDVCTLDHLHDRWSPLRKSAQDMTKVDFVAACYRCNIGRSKATQALQPIEVLHERAKRHGQKY